MSEPQSAGKKPLPVLEAERDQQPVKRAHLCHKAVSAKPRGFPPDCLPHCRIHSAPEPADFGERPNSAVLAPKNPAGFPTWNVTVNRSMRRASLDLCAGRLVEDTRKKSGLRLRLNRNREPPTHKSKSRRIKSALANDAQPSATPQPRTATANRLHIRGKRGALNPRSPCWCWCCARDPRRQKFFGPCTRKRPKRKKMENGGKTPEKKRLRCPPSDFDAPRRYVDTPKKTKKRDGGNPPRFDTNRLTG